MEAPLKIYRASAGSGKTFTLAVEYIKLLVAAPTAYKHILAVTFTNKATAEMKERILSQLFGISHSLPSSDSYFNAVRSSFPTLCDEEIRTRTHTALEMMLHDYSHFRIQTIDAFFQTILRSLSRELELSGDVSISLDGDKLLEEAVDLLITKLTPTSKEMAWLVEYIEEHLSNNKSWHISNAIKDFAKNILSEVYQEKGEELRKQIDDGGDTVLADYRKTLHSIEKEILSGAKECAERFFAIASEAGIGMDGFYQKNKGVWGYFTKLANGEFPLPNSYVNTCVQMPEKLSTSKNLGAEARNLIVSLIDESEEMRKQNQPILNSCRLSLKRFHQLRLLNSIAKILQEEINNENRFLLAQTTFLLSKMITGNTSFIFEKSSNEIRHLFIDEFQDTSALQWKNFKVLMDEIISRGNRSLIVGDVKQSIYRWRNSDWSILNNLEKQFPERMLDIITLKANRRSEHNIINFNNKFFTIAAKKISEQYTKELGKSGEELLRAYSDVEQEILTATCKGYVEVKMIDDSNDGYEANVYNRLIETLDNLINHKQVAPSDITILVRYNKEIPHIAEIFAQHFPGHTITSDDAYQLCNSTALQILIAALRHISTPDDKINALLLANLHSQAIKSEKINYDKIIHKEPQTLLPEEFTSQIENLRKKPVYELLEQLIVTLELSKIEDEEAYIYSFLDNAAKFLKENPADIEEFIAHWDEELYEKSIPAGESNGVRILSIHKSKGLEFHTVIIPFCTWELTGSRRINTLWCKPTVEPFKEISLLPIDLQNSMLDSIYKEDYNHEYLYQLVDNLNLLYVACTRAGNNLIIFSDAKGGRGDTISKRLPTFLEEITIDGAHFDKEEGSFTYGNIVPSHAEEKKRNDNPFTQQPEGEIQKFISFDNKLTFKQSKNLARFLAKEKSEQKALDYMARGELLHELLSRLRTGNELKRELKKMLLEGIIATQKESDNIEKLITKALDNPQAAEWFSGRYKLYNECTILCKEKEKTTTKRPDRVMIDGENAIVVDFKFGTPHPEHIEQVKSYMELLGKMSYTNVTGYLWYVYKNDIKKV